MNLISFSQVMPKNSTLPILLIVILSIVSCSFKKDTGSMDIGNWKADRNGCKELRIKELAELERLKNTYLGADNQALIKTFGRPDRVELVDKSQSYFIYFLEPSGECEGAETEKEPLKILFRLNSLSRVSEVTITNRNP